MAAGVWGRARGVRAYGTVFSLASALLLSSCAAAPFLIPVAIEFARNLIQTSLSNYGSKHRDNLSNFVNRLSSPYTQNLPPVAGSGSGMPAAPGYPQQAYPGQQANPAQQAYPGQQAYSGQQTYPGQVGGYDPNNPYANSSAYPGASTYPGAGTNPSGGQPGYDPNTPYGNAGGGQGYGQSPSAYGQQQPAYGSANPYGTAQPGYGAGGQPGYDPNTPYGNAGGGQGYGQSPSAYGQQQPAYGSANPYGTAQPGYEAGGQPYGGQSGAAGVYHRGMAGEPVAVDVAMIRQKQTAKGKEIVLMNDGEILRDAGGNKDAGDKFKVVVRTNCDCYLYIVAIDGSGWAEPIFPGKANNPVKKDVEYAFPEGPYWFSLDQVKGIETFYVVASANRRVDVEDSMAQLGAEKRPATTPVAKVEEPPVIPRGVGSVKPRGIMTVKDEAGTTAQVTPLSYTANQSGQDVTVTRWFKHE